MFVLIKSWMTCGRFRFTTLLSVTGSRPQGEAQLFGGPWCCCSMDSLRGWGEMQHPVFWKPLVCPPPSPLTAPV
ncbi:rCG30890, isoform CRA_b [Rattus norvegicus]|uniref:RCG30890, isoform CRA_b n=1 Tax=Rattus norvegicus TaxID=10116 RepID=A6IUI4_RAT|nr:rCG30890, isoform CRA_b [Rattus norvegicus]